MALAAIEVFLPDLSEHTQAVIFIIAKAFPHFLAGIIEVVALKLETGREIGVLADDSLQTCAIAGVVHPFQCIRAKAAEGACLITSVGSKIEGIIVPGEV